MPASIATSALAFLSAADAYRLGMSITTTTPRASVVMMPFREATAQQEVAKAAWLARVEEMFTGKVVPSEADATTATAEKAASAEAAAKAAWLARLDQPSWGFISSTLKAAAAEEEAKQAWLAKLDAPTWGAVAAAVSEVAAFTSEDATAKEEEAKQAWLAKLDAPTWGKAASGLIDIAGSVAAVAAKQAECEAGDEAACTELSSEEAAKAAWLAKLDQPTWGAMTAAVSAVATSVPADTAATAEEVAKAKWLASIEK